MSKALDTPFYEDAEIGMRVECAGSRLLGPALRSAWNQFTGDPTPRWFDGSDRLHPLTVFSAAHGMLTQRFGESAIELGVADAVVHRPSHVGTVLHTTARVIGARSDPEHPSGVVWMRVAARDEHGVVQSYVHWFRLPKKHARSEIPRNSLPSYPKELKATELHTKHLGEVPQAHEVGGRFFFEDYAVGEKIPHTSSIRTNAGEASRFARTFGMRASQFHADLPLLTLPMLVGIGYSLAHEGLELRAGLAGINNLRTPHTVFAGTRLRGLSQVIDTKQIHEDLGGVRLRLFVFADHLPDPDKLLVNDGSRYFPHVALDMDYWELIPTLKGARGIARGAKPR